mmetsp:Transcript_13906/g.30383  ORF Transcript_13906/g.30383 Transcript_13906/m.30383 type:complete len:161 (+) Transcript_13906:254-736(+)
MAHPHQRRPHHEIGTYRRGILDDFFFVERAGSSQLETNETAKKTLLDPWRRLPDSINLSIQLVDLTETIQNLIPVFGSCAATTCSAGGLVVLSALCLHDTRGTYVTQNDGDMASIIICCRAQNQRHNSGWFHPWAMHDIPMLSSRFFLDRFAQCFRDPRR